MFRTLKAHMKLVNKMPFSSCNNKIQYICGHSFYIMAGNNPQETKAPRDKFSLYIQFQKNYTNDHFLASVITFALFPPFSVLSKPSTPYLTLISALHPLAFLISLPVLLSHSNHSRPHIYPSARPRICPLLICSRVTSSFFFLSQYFPRLSLILFRLNVRGDRMVLSPPQSLPIWSFPTSFLFSPNPP